MSLTHIHVPYDGPAIICDTLVWYKNLPEGFKDKNKLAATWLSVYELFKSSDRTVGVILNSWEKIRDNSIYIIPLSPEQHYHFYLHNREVLNPEIFEQQKETLGRYNWIIEKKRKNELPDEQWQQFENEARGIKTEYDSSVKDWIDVNINDFKISERSTYQKEEDYRNMRSKKRAELTAPEGIQWHLHYITMPLIISFLTNVAFKDIEEFDTDDFAQFELFTHVFNQWLIDLDIDNIKAEVNDLVDVFNMIYVRPIDKYWTEEKQWVKRIKKVGMEHYLFDPKNL
ncbi:hypothetical protein [Spirosoma utsteinense]|uniref:hypothetical protein n=1 Tax=Spirosoma utsteinense TaxID=2585773 RepID=UPI00164460B4|nr:hypothetical protein [Spirosoma utsteinense]MBC3789000.1 hypothetical protein [Spirosoma utsteinense]